MFFKMVSIFISNRFDENWWKPFVIDLTVSLGKGKKKPEDDEN